MQPNDKLIQKFNQKQQDIRIGPVYRRSCQDICCLIVFFILFGAFIGIGIYQLVQNNSIFNKDLASIKNIVQPLSITKQLWVKYWPVIVGAIGLSLLLSILYIVLLRYCTKCMVYSMIIITILVFLGVIGVSIVSQAWGSLIAASIGLLLFLCMLCCFRKEIQRGIILLMATMQFLKSRPSVYFIPLWIFLICMIFLAFWIVTFTIIQYMAITNSTTGNTKQIIFYIFWIIMIVFFFIFFYYVMVFLIGFVCANWYYGQLYKGCCSGFKLMIIAHIGSLTFVTLLIIIVKFIYYIGVIGYQQQLRSGNWCAACCLCCLTCCFAQIQYIVQVMNRYAVITMALTGQSFIASAQTAISIIFKDFPLFYVTNSISQMIKYGGIVITAGIPTLACYLTVHLLGYQTGKQSSYNITILLVFIFILCVFISYYFVTVISISISAVFMFYCLDRRFRGIAITNQAAPDIIRKLQNNKIFNNNGIDQIVPYSADRII